MIQALCLHKFRNKNNQIIGYRVQDKNGSTMDVKAEYLKQAIKNNQIDVLNLTLTSDNKLIDKEYKTQKPQKPQKPQSNNLKDITAKIMMLGKPVVSPCGHTYYILEKPDTTIIVIPNDVKRLKPFNLKCNTIKLIGGSGLESTRSMFSRCRVKSIDFSNFDTSNVTDMSGMFSTCEAQSLDLSSFNTSNVTDMCEMFWGCQAKSLDISSFDTSKVKDMQEMFGCCHAKILNISHFSTKSLKTTADMFKGCEAEYIDLGSFNLSRVLANNGTINSIVQEDEYEEIHSIFEDCNAEIRATDPKVLSEYKRRNKVRRRYY